MLVKDDESFEGDIVQPLLNGYDTGSGGLELSAAEKPGPCSFTCSVWPRSPDRCPAFQARC